MNTKYTFKALLCGISIWAGMSLGLTSCESYLDVDSYFYDQTNIDSIFQSKVRVNEYINGIATILPNESKLFTSSYFPFGMGSDECFASWADDYGKNEKDPYRHAAMALLLGNETPQSANYNNWGSFYKGIRKANIVLTRISECKDLSDMVTIQDALTSCADISISVCCANTDRCLSFPTSLSMPIPHPTKPLSNEAHTMSA